MSVPAFRHACRHPLCERRCDKDFCGRHWAALTDDLRQRIRATSRKDQSAYGALMIEVREYFESRMIGRHEIVTCRGRAPHYANGCGADICWLTTRAGKHMPVDAGTVEPSDEGYEHGKHMPHWKTCPNAEAFRSPREA